MHKHDENCSGLHGHHDHDHNPKREGDSLNLPLPGRGKCLCETCTGEDTNTNKDSESTKIDKDSEDPERKIYCSSCKERNLKCLIDKQEHKHTHNHDHHGHSHDHHHGHHHHYEPKNWFTKIMYKKWSILGLVDDHDHHHDHIGHDHEHTFVLKKWILIAATVMGFLSLYYMLMSLFSFNAPLINIIGNDWVEMLMGVFAFSIMGFAFLKGSYITLKKKEIAEDTLVAIATTAAFLYSLFAFIMNIATDTTLPYFSLEMIEILWLIYFGRFLEEWLTNKVQKEMSSLQSLAPKKAILLVNGEEKEVDSKDIKVGDIVLVKTGAQVPVDGKVIEGTTTIDESSLTGESMPITKQIGSQVFSGTVSSNGVIKIEVTATLDNSFISKIIKSVTEAAETKPKTQRIADKIASWLVPSVLVIGLSTFITTGIVFSVGGINIPSSFQNMSQSESGWLYAFYILITVLVIACPCSFAMTTPMSVLVATTTAKKESVLLASNTLFEKVKDIDAICFDKTGTLTEGVFEVVETNIDDKYVSELVSIETKSNHPLAKSIIKHYKDVKPKDINVEDIIGKGLTGNGINVGSLKWLNELHPSFEESEDIINKRMTGSVVIYLFNDKEIIGNIILKDKIKDSTLESLATLRKLGIQVTMITGDNIKTAQNIGSQLGISDENIFAEVNPDEKADIIKQLQAKGKTVAFVGDGVNDSVALTQADLGIAVGEGSDAAIEAADIVLNANDLSLVPYSIWLSRRTIYTIKRGFGIAIVYNAVMIPLAATGVIGLTGAGPAIAATSMVFNDSIAMINALTLKAESKKKFDKKK